MAGTRDREDSWRLLHDRHADELWRFVLGLTHDRSVAEDIVQEVLLRAWRDAGLTGWDDAAARSWLFTVARRLVIDRWRSAAVRRETVTDAGLDGNDPIGATGGADRQVADATDQALDRWLIADALQALSPEHRAVVLAAHYEGQSIAAIAQRLQIAEGTVKSRLHYALRNLRLALQERGVMRP